MTKELKLNLPSADNLFSTQEERDDVKREKVLNISLSEIDGFPDHPFQVKMDESMEVMVESVRSFGVQTPAIVRQKDDGRYELVSGHRRKLACEVAGLETMPCIIRQMSRDEAVIIMVDSNLQRETILPSEKAKSYKMKLETLNRQGQRTDLTSTPMVSKLRTNEKIGIESGESREQIRRYIRLTELIPDILEMVDNSVVRDKNMPQIALRPAVELSYLSLDEQQSVLATIESDELTPSHAQAIKMRKLSEAGQLNEDVIFSIMTAEKPNQANNFKIPREKIDKFFAPGTPASKVEETIIKALELLRQRERQRNDSR